MSGNDYIEQVQRAVDFIEDIITLNPQRIIFNPETENRELMSKAQEKGIEVVEGCTLVMLGTDQF